MAAPAAPLQVPIENNDQLEDYLCQQGLKGQSWQHTWCVQVVYAQAS